MSLSTTEGLFLSLDQEQLLMAALNANQTPSQKAVPGNRKAALPNSTSTPTMSSAPGSGNLDFSDDSPFLDFDPELELGDDTFDFDENSRMIGDIPGELHDKRKSIEGGDDDAEGGRKRREGEDKTAKKPGRKPLTSEPTSKRKAQNRAAQRAFRERKEKHLRDLETKVEDLEKASESANHENGLLRAQVERLQVELKEYRKRLSWISSNGLNNRPQGLLPHQGPNSVVSHNDFQFEFPKFGDMPSLPTTNTFNNGTPQAQASPGASRTTSLPNSTSTPASQNGASRRSTSSMQNQPARIGSLSQSPMSNNVPASPQPLNQQSVHHSSVDTLSGLFSPSILEASRKASLGGYFPQTTYNTSIQSNRGSLDHAVQGGKPVAYSNSSFSNSDSPCSSTESHNVVSSIGTSPEPGVNSPANKHNEYSLNPISEEHQPSLGEYAADPGFDVNGINWLAQQNNNGFDPILFGDYRESQDNILSQDFGSFFNDAYPLPDLGSPLHNYNDLAVDQAPKHDLMQQVENARNGNDETVRSVEQPMTCNKIWDRLQSMEKFRNGEIDIDNLCSELRAKAKCSEGGAVIDKKDVDKILGVAK
ncbi:AP-1-like transcription factor yap1 [Exophiala dermatitidis]